LRVDEVREFGTIILVVGAGFSLALLTSKLTERYPVPAPAIFLLAAAVASDLFPALSDTLDAQMVERIGVVALIVILFDGGMHVGWSRFRSSLGPIASLGILGTFGTAAAMAFLAHVLLGFDWITAGLIGAALAPTDPAVMFSVLGNREVGGKTGTILEGESGANDPVGIALMLGMIELALHDDATFWVVVEEFAVEMPIGLAVGVVGAFLLRWLMQRVSLPNEGLYPIRALAVALIIYGAASVIGGSGFLAVFVAGLLVGDIRAPYKSEIERFHVALASLAEIVVFVALGLTIDITNLLTSTRLLEGIALALLLAFVARPLVAGLLLLPTRLRPGEKLFVMWGGLRGAVPILLATFVLLAGLEDAERIYDIVFVVVAFSVIVQGSSIPFVASRLRVPMRAIEPEPWDVSIRLRDEPRDMRRFVIGSGARAVGSKIRDLPLSENAWIALVIREGAAQRPRGSFVVQPDDELLILADAKDVPLLGRLFGTPGG
jgi:cell volume regulation protein A